MLNHAHLPGRIDFRTPGNPHGLRFIEGGGGAPAGAGGDGQPGGDGSGQQDPPAGGDGSGSQTDPPKPGPPKSSDQGGDAQKVEDLPEWAQKIIRDTRSEAAGNRTKATAAEQQQRDIVKAFAKAAGIDLPGEEETPDPAKLTEQLTSSQQQARQSAVELAVYKAAGKHNGDPDSLLDSRAFLAKVANLDPSADDFTTKVGEAIKSAVADNPKLKAARAAGASSVDHAGGSGETSRTPKTLGQSVAAHYGT